ncbi:MAG TPA: hypothetical protein VFG34_01070 [Sphingopyxis sp.]|nr:hypothetical protein [Sphingopyxis sp.]
MTLERLPVTFENAMGDIARRLGWDGCAAVLGKSETQLRKMGTPDTDRELSIRDAVRLDAAYRRAGGEGAPLLECYALKLDMQVAHAGVCPEAMLVGAQGAAKESGEAIAAVLALVSNPEDRKAQKAALKEVEEAISDLSRIATRIGITLSQGKIRS